MTWVSGREASRLTGITVRWSKAVQIHMLSVAVQACARGQ